MKIKHKMRQGRIVGLGLLAWIFVFTWVLTAYADEKKEYNKESSWSSERERTYSKEHDDEEKDEHEDEREHEHEHEREDDDSGAGGGLVPGENFVAIHNNNSARYRDDCTECHASIHNEQSLNTSIPTAHVSMLPFTPGKTGDDKQCVWCHRSVDLVQATASVVHTTSNIRKRVNAQQCALCHGPSGPGKQFYQASLSPSPSNGAVMYELVCAACHRSLSVSEVKGESVQDIQEAILENEGGMAPLGALNNEQINAIAAALAN